MYLAPAIWGDGCENIVVIGKPRHKSSYIEIITRSEYTENYRIQKVYTPFILKMTESSEHVWWNASEDDRQRIMEYIEFMENRKKDGIW